MNQCPACVPPPPPACRGVNSRGVGVGGSSTVHDYRMCLGGYAAWPPSVRVSHRALLSHSLTLSLSLSLPAHTPLPFSHSSPSPLILFLASYISHPLLSFLLHLLHTRRPPRISSLKTGDGDETLTSRELDHKKRKKLYHRKSASSWQEVVSSSSSSFLVLYNFKWFVMHGNVDHDIALNRNIFFSSFFLTF